MKTPQHIGVLFRLCGRTASAARRRSYIAIATQIGLAAFASQTTFATTQSNSQIETLTVYASPSDGAATQVIDHNHRLYGYADSAKIFEQIAGTRLNTNGPISGQIQYRGLFGPRTSVRINGLKLPSGGPNWMDPPMHYVPSGLLKSVSLTRGITGVDSNGIGAQATAEWRQPEYQANPQWQTYLNINSHYRTNSNARAVATTVGGSTDQFRIHIAASDESANDYAVAQGRLNGTEYERQTYGVSLGFEGEQYAAELNFHTIASDDAGTPTLPLDIDFFNTDIWQASLSRNLPSTHSSTSNRIKLSVAASQVRHGMENFNLRPAPDFSSLPLPPFTGPDARRVRADADAIEARLRFDHTRDNHRFAVGVDYHDSEHTAQVTDPDFGPFFVNNFSASRQRNIALFGQWITQFSAGTTLELGIRTSDIKDTTGPVDAFPARLVDNNPSAFPAGTPPRAVWLLRERFNQQQTSSDLEQNEMTTDWTLKLSHNISRSTRSNQNHLNLEFGLARKTRSPIYLERYLWIPLEINAGLGDGNNYVGNANLEAEVAHQIEIGLNWQNNATYLSPRVFYHQIDDFIQGTLSTDPVTIAVSANANGDATPQQFNNVKAELYGFDMAFGWQINPKLSLQGTAAWVRGKRRDTDDNLYRIAPPSLNLRLTWQEASYEISFEQQIVAQQNNLSATLTQDPSSSANSFRTTGGYSLSNVYTSLRLSRQFTLSLGVENLFDKHYRDPLSGFNRNADVGREVGRRLPGLGRNTFISIEYQL